MYQVGSQIPNLLGQEWIAEAQEVRDFLDKAILERGPKSVLYIRQVASITSPLTGSFGSILFAPTKDQLIHLLDVLEELDRQYILVQGNLNPDVRPGVREVMEERVGKNGLGLLVDWAPQRAVLGHPVSLSKVWCSFLTGDRIVLDSRGEQLDPRSDSARHANG